MSVAKEIKIIREQVKTLLTNDPKYRDSDKILSAKIWSIQIGGMNKLKETTAYDFLIEYIQKKGKLFSQESIGRARRKIQEEFPELRGKKYKAKKEHQADVVAVVYGRDQTQ